MRGKAKKTKQKKKTQHTLKVGIINMPDTNYIE